MFQHYVFIEYTQIDKIDRYKNRLQLIYYMNYTIFSTSNSELHHNCFTYTFCKLNLLIVNKSHIFPEPKVVTSYSSIYPTSGFNL